MKFPDMPDSKQRLKAARKVYEIYRERYTKRDMEAFASILDERYKMVCTHETGNGHSKAEGSHVLGGGHENNAGIHEDIKYRILQPFFTTRSARQETGLGLSYGIVKAHGGELMVETKIHEGTTFLIQLPFA